MTARDYATPVFNSLDESQLLDFMRFFADDNTLARMESDIIAAGAHRKIYNNFQELLDEIEDDESRGRG